MAVYQQAYKRYTGPLNPPGFVPLVITRYALRELFENRLFLVFFVLSFGPALLGMSVIYMRYNLEMLAQIRLPIEELVTIDAAFFALWVQMPQSVLAFLMILFAGPALVSPDLHNNAMPLYLSRPVGRHRYVAGKLLALMVPGSLITWVPALLLVLLQSLLEGGAWFAEHAFLPVAMVVSALVWLVSLSMLSLAISAWVKWKPVARLTMLAAVLIGSAFGEVIRDGFGGWGGNVFSLFAALESMVHGLFGLQVVSGLPASATISIFVVITVASTLILYTRLRSVEVAG